MRLFLGGTLAALAFGFGLSAQEKKDEKIDGAKLVGKWEPKEKDDRMFLMVFAKDGKLTVSHVADGKEVKYDGSYKLAGNKLTVTMKAGDKERTDTRIVTKLTDTEMVSTDDKGAKEFTMVRKDK